MCWRNICANDHVYSAALQTREGDLPTFFLGKLPSLVFGNVHKAFILPKVFAL
jgi:hypothetical protein